VRPTSTDEVGEQGRHVDGSGLAGAPSSGLDRRAAVPFVRCQGDHRGSHPGSSVRRRRRSGEPGSTVRGVSPQEDAGRGSRGPTSPKGGSKGAQLIPSAPSLVGLVIRRVRAGPASEEKTDKGRDRRTSRDTGVNWLFGAVSSFCV
jgi:hypothetical protein